MENCERKSRRAGCQKRLARIEGQVRGLSKMIDEDRYCVDILVQIKAVKAALGRVEAELLKDHASHCVADALRSDDAQLRDTRLNELVDLLTKR